MSFGVTVRGKVRSFEIREALNVQGLLLIEKSHLRWFDRVFGMSE